jgi:Fe-S cluster assembly iron-binding protein IscA
MKSSAQPLLLPLLNSATQLQVADLITFQIPGGLTLRYTSTALPVVVGGNLILLSQTAWSGAPWSLHNTTVSGGAGDPAGGVQAAHLVETAATATQFAVDQTVAISAGKVCTVSCFLKAAERGYAALSLYTPSYANGFGVQVNLGAGTLGALAAVGAASVYGATITPAGAGWFRVSVTGIVDSSSTSANPTLYINNAMGSGAAGNGYNGIVGYGIYAWGMQVEPLPYMTAYSDTAARALPSITWQGGPGTPNYSRGKSTTAIGTQVDKFDLTLDADLSVLVNGQPLLAFINGGGLDYARVIIQRGFAGAFPNAYQPGGSGSSSGGPVGLLLGLNVPSSASSGLVPIALPAVITPVGLLTLFSGRVSEVQIDRSTAKITVSSDVELLNVQVPRNVYQPGCLNTLFDKSCLLNSAAYTTTIAATSATDSTRTLISASGLSMTAGYANTGTMIGLTGANAGIARTVKQQTASTVQTIGPWPLAVSVGDTFSITAGCDKQSTTCSGKFSNLIHFRGFPWVPVPQTVA